MTTEREPTDEEIEAWDRQDLFLEPEDDRATPSLYPRLWNISAGMLYRAIVRPDLPDPVEYVTLPMPISRGSDFTLDLAVAQWNMLWEAGQFRRRFFDPADLPTPLDKIADHGDVNIVFVPRTRTRYHEYSPLYHLLSRATIDRFGLPLLNSGQWPLLMKTVDVDRYLPFNFEARLAKAWAATVWRHLISGSPMSGFSASDPIRLLAHNLDFWIPAVTEVIQEKLRDWPEVNHEVSEGPVRLVDGSFLDGAVAANPRVGGDIWRGEEEAAAMVRRTVDKADVDGRLRGIIDAVRSNRVEDDFSDRWTYEREDFERKLYNKRSKVRVHFVELTDKIPVQSPETEIIDRTVFGDFLTLLDERDRKVVVLLYSGYTKLTDIAQMMGYANHSPISKRLTEIRKTAADFFESY